jgi:formylglycine-generating enzyme required for sulfatase activity
MYENGMSGYGILNLSGNVAEWVSDLYAENWYSTTNQPENPTGPENGAYRILRGGSWLTSQNTAQTVNRFQSLPTGAGFDRGFRCVRQD